MKHEEFKLRRDGLLKQLGNDSAAIIFAAKEYVRSGSACYPYRQDSDFYYLTGFTEPEAIAVFVPGKKDGQYILFNQKHDATKTLWHGAVVGQEKACSEFSADQAFPIEDANIIIPKLLANQKKIYANADHDFDLKSKLQNFQKLINLGEISHEMRLKKRPYEIALMRKAVAITTSGFLRAMRRCHPGMKEFELESELLYEFMRLGGRYEAFKTIVGGGANACVLHYANNNNILADGELVLVDAGIEYEYYCSDVSRTFPINGKFTKEQRAIYEAVLATQTEIINQIRPGIKFNSLQLLAEKIIAMHLVDLNLLKNNLSCKDFFMHKISHWLGLEAHDVGKYLINNEWRILEPGMVLTVEPGIYIKPNILVENKWHNIGVRIEDEILVTENGCEILTKEIPKSIIDLNSVMLRKKYF